MNKLFAFFLFLILLTSKSGTAQKIMFSYGTTISVLQDEGRLTYGTFSPRYNFSESDNSSLSVGIPLSLGVGGIEDGGVFFVGDFPVTADFNIGSKSTAENESGFGGYIGAGFGYTYLNYNDGYGSEKAKQVGPLVHAGVRFNISKNSSSALEIGFFYKRGIDVDKLQSAGIHILLAH